jgi:hypothetical protein
MGKQKITGKQAQALYEACQKLIQGYTTGDCYHSTNPYARPYVENALKVLAEIQGKEKHNDADLIQRTDPAKQYIVELEHYGRIYYLCEKNTAAVDHYDSTTENAFTKNINRTTPVQGGETLDCLLRMKTGTRALIYKLTGKPIE